MWLSLIGRETPKTLNTLLTSESEEMRKAIEKNFLDMLYSRYEDVEVRDILSRHFMLFKEAMLVNILRICISEDRFYNIVYQALISRLSEGLSFNKADEYHVYRTVFLDYLHKAFASNAKTQDAIPYSLWSTAIEKYPKHFTDRDRLGLFQNYFLCNVYLYAYDTLSGTLEKLGVM